MSSKTSEYNFLPAKPKHRHKPERLRKIRFLLIVVAVSVLQPYLCSRSVSAVGQAAESSPSIPAASPNFEAAFQGKCPFTTRLASQPVSTNHTHLTRRPVLSFIIAPQTARYRGSNRISHQIIDANVAAAAAANNNNNNNTHVRIAR